MNLSVALVLVCHDNLDVFKLVYPDLTDYVVEMCIYLSYLVVSLVQSVILHELLARFIDVSGEGVKQLFVVRD